MADTPPANHFDVRAATWDADPVKQAAAVRALRG